MKRFLPQTIWTKLRHEVNADVRRERAQESAGIPRVALGPQHIRNLTILPTRDELLDCLRRDAVVAEIGVDQGFFSRSILDRTQPRKLHLVDAWGDARFHTGLMNAVQQAFAPEIQAGRVEIHRGLSTEVLPTFESAYFDWIYIDTDHSYETTRAELALARAKVKRGGIIAGHDFILGNWVEGIRYGVIESVREFCVEHGWEIRYLTSQADGHDSFALREISEA